MTSSNGRQAHRSWALGAAAVLVATFAVAFLALSSASADAPAATRGSSGLRYALLPNTAAPAASVPAAVGAAIGPSPHGPTYGATADECATCHRTHTGQNKNLIKSPSPQSNLCLSCHDGLGATSDVKAQFADPLVPANDDVNRLYYRHDTIGPIQHTGARYNEFGGVSNRHSECGDCHNPHQANGTPGSVMTATGVQVSGRLAGVSGVSVVNSPTPGVAPAYTFLDGTTPLTSITREYQLCFKCHSSFTTLSNAGFTASPSKYVLDKAAEFNPANPSFHPVEAKGKNVTAAMSASLAGPSPYKLWNFTVDSTIRCSNCHASSSKFQFTAPKTPVDGDLPPHTSQFRGILLQKYEDRVLKIGSAAYSSADFALCFMCHTNTPFIDGGSTSSNTNFGKHDKHTAGIGDKGTLGTNIDTPGVGNGNALCAECHFRLHSTTFKDVTVAQNIPGSRLVNFSPNVKANGGVRSWSQTGRSCTLTCHGYSHDNKTY